jgi:hypothetical protein
MFLFLVTITFGVSVRPFSSIGFKNLIYKDGRARRQFYVTVLWNIEMFKIYSQVFQYRIETYQKN